MAKPVNFGMIYGLGVASLRAKAKTDYSLDLSEVDAKRYKRAFFRAYPGVKGWHSQIKSARASETRTLAGRRVLVKPGDFYGAKANYVIQGSGGDAIKLHMLVTGDDFPAAIEALALRYGVPLPSRSERATTAGGRPEKNLEGVLEAAEAFFVEQLKKSDEARDYLVQDLLRSQFVARLGWVQGVGATPPWRPRVMADGTGFFTDGLRAVMILSTEALGLDEIEFLRWEEPPAGDPAGPIGRAPVPRG